MKFLFASILLMCIVALVIGDGCDVKGKKLKAGEKYSPPGECNQITCHDDGNISGLTCAATSAGPNCKLIPMDKSKPYPECCEKYKC